MAVKNRTWFFYTQALDAQTAADEAEYVLQVIKDFPVSYPVAYDVESNYLFGTGFKCSPDHGKCKCLLQGDRRCRLLPYCVCK